MSKIKTALKLLKENPDALGSNLAGKISRSNWGKKLSDKHFLQILYRLYFGKKLNLKNPKTFNEKLQWIKLHDRKEEYPLYVDKYEVKKYVADKLGDEYVIENYGVWDRVEDIDFDSLPKQFVIKCTHDSGSVIVCRDKDNFDFEGAKAKLKKKLETNLFWYGREWPYKDLKPRILAEKYLSELADEEMIDYKFFCFNGEPKFLYVSQGLENHETGRISYASLDWEIEPFRRTDFANFTQLPPKPAGFDKMIELSKQLSKDIPFVRVDFYDVNSKIYFGELTFFPGAGFTKFEPAEWDAKIGEWLDLPKV